MHLGSHGRVVALLILFFVATSATSAPHAQQRSATAVVHADQPGAKIDRHIYGQFAEHLGRGIYEGIWVGENSPIPNEHGFRSDVVKALRDLRVPLVPMNTTGAMVSGRAHHAP
jgi:alpha-L-arabinofuranosidase